MAGRVPVPHEHADGVELVPHLFGTANNFPTGQRGIFALWRNSSVVLVEQAFRLLVVK